MEVPIIGFSYKTHLQDKKCSFFTKSRENTNEKVIPFLKKMKTIKKNTKIIFCDNAGENKTLKENCTKFLKLINFEFMSPGTSQQNGVIE